MLARLETLEVALATSPTRARRAREPVAKQHGGLPDGRLQQLEDTSNVLGLRALARRCGLSDAAILKARKTKTPEDFKNWSASKDPEGVAWAFTGEKYQRVSRRD